MPELSEGSGVATTVPQGQIDAMIRWAVGPLWSSEPDPALALTNLDGGVTRLALAPGRDTIVESTKADPANPRYARTPDAGACEFCLMLAGRGAVYAEDTAGFDAHDRCKCGAVPIFDGDTIAYHFHEPLGVVGQIIPWNFPILMAAWKLAPALGAGNCVVLKPAESTPVSILILAELIADLLPPGVLNIVNGFGVAGGVYSNPTWAYGLWGANGSQNAANPDKTHPVPD